ncbi:MAG TPA: tyrosine-type recombinase/integrase [Streptosporangiaceae bacterium]|nr:tyrosine-type recombinase/integrase [Streptosporangiaceae bacterium]
MSVYDRWHLAHPPAGAKKCGQHRKAPSSAHGTGLRWQVRGTDQDGRQVKQNFEFEEDAKDKEAELKASVRAGTFVDDRAGKITFQVYAEQWRKTRVHDPVTAERIRSAFENHVYEGRAKGAAKGKTAQGGNSIGQYPMAALSRRVSIVQGWIASLPGHANTALLMITDVSQVFRAAVDDKIIALNPLAADSVQKPRPVESQAVAWPRERVEAVAAELPAGMQPMPYLGACCAHRQGELCAVALEDLDFLRKTCGISYQVKYMDVTGVADLTSPPRPSPLRGKILVFAPTKNKKPREVPVADEVILMLSAHLAGCPATAVTLPRVRRDGKIEGDLTRRLVFTNGGRPWYRGTVQRPWDRARKAAGVPAAAQVNGWHVLRHTAASEWLSKGLGLAKTAAYLGDTQGVVLKTYSHFMPADEDRAREIMNAFFSAPAESADAPRMTSDLPAGSLWLLRVLLLHYRTNFSGMQAGAFRFTFTQARRCFMVRTRMVGSG